VTKYRKLPIEVDAIHFTGFDYEAQDDGPVVAFLDPANRASPSSSNPAGRWFFLRGWERLDSLGPWYVYLTTLDEGTMRVDPGDYIIRGIKGELYPCKPDIFEATYERSP
jgi:hypothetical protein